MVAHSTDPQRLKLPTSLYGKGSLEIVFCDCVENMSSRQEKSISNSANINAATINQEKPENPTDLRAILVNKILSWVVSIIESQSMRKLEDRVSILVSGGWLPGHGDAKTIAALTNRPIDSIEDISADFPRPKYKVGRQTFYRLCDFAKSAEKEPTDAPAMRKKKP